MELKTDYRPNLKDVDAAAKRLKGVSVATPLLENHRLSTKYNASIFFKREDLQRVRSYKIRGAYNKISTLEAAQTQNGVVCASAGNHAQGFAYTCQALKIKGTVFMPSPTPKQKIEQVRMFGQDFVEVIIEGDNFDESKNLALAFTQEKQATFIHPFDDPKTIEGQATVGLEIIQASEQPIDYVFLPVGGGGLAAGVSAVFQTFSPDTKVIGVEPEKAPSMSVSIQKGVNTELPTIDKFVDGAAVKRVGDYTFQICKEILHKMITVPEGKVCQEILELYNKDAIVAEPAGALSIAALDFFEEEIEGKNVVCVLSGSNNDISRTEEIKERALLYQGLKHYFIVTFPQRAGALKEFVVEVLGENDDITHFEYTKKTSREKGSAVVGIELKNQQDFEPLLARMKERQFLGEYINDKESLLSILV